MERIYNNRYKKPKAWYLITGIGLLFVAMIQLPIIMRGDGGEYDYMIVISPVIVFTTFFFQQKNWKSQYIEFNDTAILYKLGRKLPEQRIPLNEIESIEINLDIINIQLKDGNKEEVNIEDYYQYEDRIKIKQNFEKLG